MPGFESQPFTLSGRVAIVTGGASGIGAGIAQVLAQAGASVVIVDRDAEGASRQARTLTETGLQATAVTIDLADEQSIVRGCAEIVRNCGVPWALINNAGLQNRELLLEGTSEFWDLNFSVNTRGPFLMTREVARAMVDAKQGGRIVHVASTALIGQIAFGHSAYAASKAALLGLARASAMELAEHAITVNILLPGGVMTPGSIGAQGPAPQGPATRRPPFGYCEPRDLANAALFLVSDEARMITNQVLAVDGGWSVT